MGKPSGERPIVLKELIEELMISFDQKYQIQKPYCKNRRAFVKENSNSHCGSGPDFSMNGKATDKLLVTL